MVRIPPDLHRELKEEANRQGLSLNQICVARLRGDGGRLSLTNHAPASCPVPGCVIAAVLRRWGADLAGLLLFGSAARNEATAESDVDILLVLAPGIKLTRRLYHEWDLLSNDFDADGRRVSPQFVTLPKDAREAGGLWCEVALEGVVLWERNLVVSALLRRIRETMARGELRRGMIHGNPYWVRIDEAPHEE